MKLNRGIWELSLVTQITRAGEMDVATISPKVKYELEGELISCVVHIPSNDLIAFVCDEDPRIQVYKNDVRGELVHIFEEHATGDKFYGP